MSGLEAAELTRLVWDSRREKAERLLRRRGFTAKAAARAIRTFIDTQVFVAAETCEPRI